MNTKLEGMALVCTEMMNGVCLVYRFVPYEEAELIVDNLMKGGNNSL